MRRRDFITLLGSTVAAWPLAGRAQQLVPVIGFLSSRSANDSASVEAAFRTGLRDTGFTVGQNVQVIYGWAEGQFDRLPSLAAELVERRVSVIVAVGGNTAADAAKAATTTIPIVFITGSDPAKTGLVARLNRPESNVTGIALLTSALEQKRLELLRELVPKVTMFGKLLNPTRRNSDVGRDEIQSAARSLGEHIQVRVLDASTARDIETAFEDIARSKIEALLVGTDALFSTERKRILTLAARYGVPAMYDSRIQVEEGGLISYGTSYADAYREAGMYAGRILKGARPADLPVLLPTKFELVIDAKTAKTLGLTVPPGVLVAADEVIE
jgi:putative tryptophan/tyrosine transport system substrate-binding protein